MTEEGGLEVGDHVVDTHAAPAEGEGAIVVELPETTAENTYTDDLGTTVADVNPDYPRDDPVARVAFVDALDTWASGWEHVPPDELAAELDALGTVECYTYPVSRLAPVEDDA